MSLSDVQQQFSSHLTDLFEHIRSLHGVTFTLGESYRTQEQAEINALTLKQRKDVESILKNSYPELAAAIGGSTSQGVRNSVHRLKLAQDINIFLNGEYQEGGDVYKQLGEWWKQQHPDARYGGDWGDGDHFSFVY